jgi:hypothetical protein
MKEGHVRIRSWEEFRNLVKEKKPQSIVFILEQNGFSPNKELTTLRLIMLHDQRTTFSLTSPKAKHLEKQRFLSTKTKTEFPT